MTINMFIEKLSFINDQTLCLNPFIRIEGNKIDAFGYAANIHLDAVRTFGVIGLWL